MLKAVGIYNKFPQGFTRPKKLKRDEVVTYKLDDHYKREDPAKKGTYRYPASVKIPVTDQIFIGDDVVDIGLITKVDKDGNVDQMKPIWVVNALTGEFSFTGGIAEQEMQYEYCELCNYNGDKENRDESRNVFFHRVDAEKNADKVTKTFGLRLECMKYVDTLTDGEARKLAASFGWDEKKSPKVLKAELYQEAEKDPVKFKKLVSNPDVHRKASIKRALDKGILKYNAPQNKYLWSDDTVIATLPRVEGAKHLEQFSEWLNTHKNGHTTFKQIEKLLDQPETVEA
jgi:hypothetical protein